MNLPPEISILEAIVTTESEDGRMHVAPMGPEVDLTTTYWRLKPFQTSTTFSNLRRTNRCVVHVVDDVKLLAEAVLGRANEASALYSEDVGFVLEDACHWYGLEVTRWDVSEQRAFAECRVVRDAVVRPFFGWNRGKHAVIELAIIASRIGLLDAAWMKSELKRLVIAVEKTGSDAEHEAFELLSSHILSEIAAGRSASATSPTKE